MSELGDALTARYTSRLQALRDQVRGAVAKLYSDTVTPDDLDAAFAALTTRITPLVRAGQARGVALSGAYLQVLVALESGRPADFSPFSAGIVGTTAQGLALEQGMAAWPSMVKQQIGKGVPLEQAMTFGSYLAERFADAEVTSAVDRHTEAVTQQSGQFSGWIGVIAGTCDLCREQNAGEHALGEDVYRHPNCKCTKQFVVEGARPSATVDAHPADSSVTYGEAIARWTGSADESKSIRDAIASNRLDDTSRTIVDLIANHSIAAPRLYRGIATRDPDRFIPDRVIDLGPSSFSSSKSIAQDFMQDPLGGLEGERTLVLFRLDRAQAVNIEPLAPEFWKHQQEWITSGRFRVTTTGFRGDVLEVNLTQEAVIRP